jgi:hypothetical protein
MNYQALFEQAANASAEALISAAQETVHVSRDEVISLTAASLLALFGHFASAFSTHFAFACLKALVSSHRGADRSIQLLQRLLRNPRATGINVLGIAMMLESELGPTPSKEQREYVMDRYKNARGYFDAAAQNVESKAEKNSAEKDEAAVIEMYRGLTALRIPGGRQEALSHLRCFSDHCAYSAEHARIAVSKKLRTAQDLRERAHRILVEHVRGLGAGTFVAMGAFEDRAEREGLIFEAKRREAEALRLERRATAFDTAVKAIQLL